MKEPLKLISTISLDSLYHNVIYKAIVFNIKDVKRLLNGDLVSVEKVF